MPICSFWHFQMECNYANCIISLYWYWKLDATIDPRVVSFVYNVIFTRFISAQHIFTCKCNWKEVAYSFYWGLNFVNGNVRVVTMHFSNFQKRYISIERYELLTNVKACIYLRGPTWSIESSKRLMRVAASFLCFSRLSLDSIMDSDILEKRFLKITKRFAKLSGIWPDQNKYLKYISWIIIYVISIPSVIVQVRDY